MTPPELARQLAAWLPFETDKSVKLLDAGAGQGGLSLAFAERWLQEADQASALQIDTYEVDPKMNTILEQNVLNENYSSRITFNSLNEDFISSVLVQADECEIPEQYSHVILNPPYLRIRRDTEQSRLLRSAGLSATNLYSAFVSLALRQLQSGGQMIAIIPRSFCNGQYYKEFRQQILNESSIQMIHVFRSRTDLFKGDGVLQENVVMLLQKGVPQSKVTVSFSTNVSLDDQSERVSVFEEIVDPGDSDKVIRLHLEPQATSALSKLLSFSLDELGLSASTGPVVDFRTKAHLSQENLTQGVPLIHAHHVQNSELVWPSSNLNKCNILGRHEETEKYILPVGNYVVLRRFSSNEQSHRIISNPVAESTCTEFNGISFENHVNYFHRDKRGISLDEAWGLSAYLNTTTVDEMFRGISGSTQVNLSDLRRLKYPSMEDLIKIGILAQQVNSVSSVMVDDIVTSILASKA